MPAAHFGSSESSCFHESQSGRTVAGDGHDFGPCVVQAQKARIEQLAEAEAACRCELLSLSRRAHRISQLPVLPGDEGCEADERDGSQCATSMSCQPALMVRMQVVTLV